VKSASFTAFTSAPASTSTLTVSSATGARTPRATLGVNVDRPNPAATISGVVPSSVAASSARNTSTDVSGRFDCPKFCADDEPFSEYAATHRGVAPRRSPVPHA
jgi:hypothetical protein